MPHAHGVDHRATLEYSHAVVQIALTLDGMMRCIACRAVRGLYIIQTGNLLGRTALNLLYRHT